jgi:uncharacterized lipoprotein YbaY
MVTGGCHHRALRAPLWPKLLFSLCFLSVIPLSKMESPRVQPAIRSQEPANSAQSPNPQQSPAPLPTNPPVLKRSPLRFVLPRRIYQCSGGVQLVALVETDALRIMLSGQVYDLKKAESTGSNTKYSSGSIVWSTYVQTGTLEDDSDAAHPKILAKDCHLQSTFPPGSPANSISGTLSLALPKDLPPSAEIRVQLLDLKPSDEQHKYVGEITLSAAGRKLPISFELKFDPQNIRSKDCCALYAEIRVDDKTEYATAKPQAVPDLTSPSPVKLELTPLTPHRRTAQP